MQLHEVVIDFETYLDSKYSLSHINPILYVHDPRFEVITFAYKEIGGKAEWFSGTHDECKAVLDSLQLDKRTVVAHNAMFDGSILEWKFGIKPARYFCTMMGSRPYIAPFTGSMRLAKCAEFIGLEHKKGNEVSRAEGKRRTDFSAEELLRYSMYCVNDVELTASVYQWLLLRMPTDEADILDLTIKKYTRPRLVIDRSMLEQAADELEQKEATALLSLAALDLKRIDVTSNQRFAEALHLLGVEVPKKLSPTTGSPTFAFSKKDPEFMALAKHTNPKVRQLVEVRLLLKSSLERTRLVTFMEIERATGGLLPVPLLYYGAHTGRFSGTSGINMQNLPRGSILRKAIKAAAGYKVVSVDLSAIEARITAALANQMDLVCAFRDGEDVYSKFASDVYGFEVTKDTHPIERFVGKTAILGLGFGMGAAKYVATMASAGVAVETETGEKVVYHYRHKYGCIPLLWKQMDALLSNMMAMPRNSSQDWRDGLLRVSPGKVELPNRMPIFYPKMARDRFNKITYEVAETPAKAYAKALWGGAMTENIVQALARIIISRAELRLAKAGLVSVLQVHDELVFVVPEHTVPTVTDIVRKVVTDPVPWLPMLPIACEIGVGDSYGDAK